MTGSARGSSAATVNRRRDRPEWYNGRLDEHLYEVGAVRRDLSLAELRAKAHVNSRSKAVDRDPEFSRRIREGVPDP